MMTMKRTDVSLRYYGANRFGSRGNIEVWEGNERTNEECASERVRERARDGYAGKVKFEVDTHLPDVVQAAEEHDDALQTHAGASVGVAAALERVEVRLDLVQRDAVLPSPLREQLSVVHSLRAADNLLSANEDVERRRVVRVLRVRHRVKGTDAERELV